MIYIFIFLLLIYLIYRYDYKHNERGRLFWLVVVTLIFIVLGGLHYRVGFDSLTYEKFYDKLSPLNTITPAKIESSRFAPGFVILASFTKLFNEEPVLLYFIQSGFLCAVVTWFFVKNTRNVFFAFLMFYAFCFTLLVFEQIRESIAVAFFLLAWPAFKSNNWLKYYILSFCALAFHTSATFMFILPIILLPGIKQLFIFGKRTWLFCLIVLAIAFVLQATFSQYIKLLAVTESMEELTGKYENTSFIKGNLNILGIVSVIFRDILYPLLALVYFNAIKKRGLFDGNNERLEMFVILSIYISILSIGVPILSRYNNYFFFFPIVLISDWLFSVIIVGRRKVRFSFVYWIVIVFPMFITQINSAYFTKMNNSGTKKGYMAYYPYTSYINKEKDADRVKVIQKFRRKRH